MENIGFGLVSMRFYVIIEMFSSERCIFNNKFIIKLLVYKNILFTFAAK